MALPGRMEIGAKHNGHADVTAAKNNCNLLLTDCGDSRNSSYACEIQAENRWAHRPVRPGQAKGEVRSRPRNRRRNRQQLRRKLGGEPTEAKEFSFGGRGSSTGIPTTRRSGPRPGNQSPGAISASRSSPSFSASRFGSCGASPQSASTRPASTSRPSSCSLWSQRRR